uniref:Uncharacterized protein n=1 Tax=Chromera velia CCMP2878 TaxID=1169474 RepID=A0A0G4GU42_9ALVE|mmetsp:Transcript_24887/g.48741  ORF Transcript_24887/g.48741 Transcript_24887/m.48741 type:complete len:81 (+) Transcript_24887:327-569(+)|eukprot:Cvel_23360.t1-p1 / transcript=Cvel_23360.t1 / gene=Cvel_23360 / organism=Chromera_velia_CCMP2878 / gene_product=hypothetical protein / transcript_product=hypothetical protein / location=Cvel_scaffold2398:10062-11807(-) / protein_length=80 / sequence_SO=supercontig / SO=protein_coding / is_pseudo=false
MLWRAMNEFLRMMVVGGRPVVLLFCDRTLVSLYSGDAYQFVRATPDETEALKMRNALPKIDSDELRRMPKCLVIKNSTKR